MHAHISTHHHVNDAEPVGCLLLQQLTHKTTKAWGRLREQATQLQLLRNCKGHQHGTYGCLPCLRARASLNRDTSGACWAWTAGPLSAARPGMVLVRSTFSAEDCWLATSLTHTTSAKPPWPSLDVTLNLHTAQTEGPGRWDGGFQPVPEAQRALGAKGLSALAAVGRASIALK